MRKLKMAICVFVQSNKNERKLGPTVLLEVQKRRGDQESVNLQVDQITIVKVSTIHTKTCQSKRRIEMATGPFVAAGVSILI